MPARPPARPGQIDLLETGSHCNVFTAALTTKNQRQDVHSTIRHKAEGTTCLQEQRNVVSDTADCVFKGRIVIDVSGLVSCCCCCVHGFRDVSLRYEVFVCLHTRRAFGVVYFLFFLY